MRPVWTFSVFSLQSYSCFRKRSFLRTEWEQAADQVSVDIINLWTSNTTRLLEKCCKIWWHTHGGIGDSCFMFLGLETRREWNYWYRRPVLKFSHLSIVSSCPSLLQKFTHIYCSTKVEKLEEISKYKSGRPVVSGCCQELLLTNFSIVCKVHQAEQVLNLIRHFGLCLQQIICAGKFHHVSFGVSALQRSIHNMAVLHHCWDWEKKLDFQCPK